MGEFSFTPYVWKDPKTLPLRKGHWRLCQLRGMHAAIVDLWLYPELDCSSCVQDCEDADGAEQLQFYVEYIKRKHPAWWEDDAVPIYWTVRGEGSDSICEEAPCGNQWMHAQLASEPENILTRYEIPYDVRTDEPVNWWRLISRRPIMLSLLPTATIEDANIAILPRRSLGRPAFMPSGLSCQASRRIITQQAFSHSLGGKRIFDQAA
jgi:hypothetical protein